MADAVAAAAADADVTVQGRPILTIYLTSSCNITTERNRFPSVTAVTYTLW